MYGEVANAVKYPLVFSIFESGPAAGIKQQLLLPIKLPIKGCNFGVEAHGLPS